MQEKLGTQVPSLGQEDPLEEKMATHSSILAWRMPWTEEPGGPQFMVSQNQARLRVCTHISGVGLLDQICCCMHVYLPSHFSCVQLFVTPWTVVHKAPLSMGFSRQEYWSGLPFSPPGDLLNPGIEPTSPAL